MEQLAFLQKRQKLRRQEAARTETHVPIDIFGGTPFGILTPAKEGDIAESKDEVTVYDRVELISIYNLFHSGVDTDLEKLRWERIENFVYAFTSVGNAKFPFKGREKGLVLEKFKHDLTSRPVLHPSKEWPKGDDLDLILYFYIEFWTLYQERIGGNDFVDEAGQTLAIPGGQWAR